MTKQHNNANVICMGGRTTGVNIALVTDAGTPGISDPGEELVRQCYDAGIEVTSLPGPAVHSAGPHPAGAERHHIRKCCRHGRFPGAAGCGRSIWPVGH